MKSRPSEVSKFFSDSMAYSGGPREPLFRRYENFKRTYVLSTARTSDTSFMMHLFDSVLLKDSAILFYMEHIKGKLVKTEKAIDFFESHSSVSVQEE